MIKLTEEVWNKAIEELGIELGCAVKEEFTSVIHITQVMRHIYKTEISEFHFNALGFDFDSPLDTTLEPILEEVEKEVFLQERLQRYNLSPAFVRLTNESIFTKSNWWGAQIYRSNEVTEAIERPLFLLGEGILITLRSRGKYVYPFLAFYVSNETVTDKVKQFYNELLEEAKKIQEREEERMRLEVDKGKVKFVYIDSDEGVTFTGYKKFKLPKNTITNFNEDLPLEKLNQFINMDYGGGIAILHGKPGCGKTSLIRYLIATNRNIDFYICPQEVLISRMEEFKSKLYELSTSVFIVEDCERLLKSREANSGDITLGEILNMTDGILGDILNVKFIFTFNTGLPKIDQALLRKGRLKVKYEVRPLIGKKLEELTKGLGIELNEKQRKEGMSLADIYNYNEVVNIGEKPETKIGF